MSYSTSSNNIKLTRGDTAKIKVDIETIDGDIYEPKEGDRVVFTVKRYPTDKQPIFVKDIPINTLILVLNSEDTKNMEFGTYRFDVQLIFGNGEVDTFIENKTLQITYEQD